MGTIINLDVGRDYGALMAEKALARKAIARRFGLQENSAFPALGATGAIDRLFSEIEARTNQNRKALVPRPEYWRAILRMRSRFKIQFIDAPSDSNFKTDIPAFIETAEALRPDLIYLSQPTNPTGNLYDIQKIISHLPKETTLVIDTTLIGIKGNTPLDLRREIKRWLSYKDKKIAVIGSLSKSHDAVQLRFGWILTQNQELKEALESTDSVFPPADNLQKGIQLISKPCSPAVAERLRESHALLAAGVAKGSYQYIKGDTNAGYVLLKLQPNFVNAWRDRLDKAGIRIAFGEKFGLPEQFVRIEMSEPRQVQKLLAAVCR